MPYDDCELTQGVTFEELAETEFSQHVDSVKHGWVRLQPYNQIFPKAFLRDQKRMKEFECRDNDVWVASFPKTGTTWTLELVYAIMNDLDYAKSSSKTQEERIPFIELRAIHEEWYWDLLAAGAGVPDPIEQVKQMPRDCPRVLKTHFSVDMLPDQVMQKRNKVVCVTRNPRDTAVSYFNHYKVLEGYTGTFEALADAFIKNEGMHYAPFMDNVKGYWEKRREPNILFITYEEMKRDLPDIIRKVSAFLGKPVAEKDIPELADFLSFNKMKANPAMNKQSVVDELQKSKVKPKDGGGAFMNKGQTGNWKKHFTPELEKRFEEWEAEELKGSDLKFKNVI